MAEIKEKRWDKDFEPEIIKAWKDSGRYSFNKDSGKKVFSIDTPPPYVNTPVHIGQATTYVLMDMFARFRRMKGYEILFPMGLDRNGLPIEMAAEKKYKIKLTDISREAAIKHCEAILLESSAASKDIFQRAGISFNSWEEGTRIGDVYQTDSPEYRQLTQDTFIELYHKGLIYEDERINNYCPGCQTTIADAEIEYVDVASRFNEVRFKCKETGKELIIGTTRPELICTCGMVIYNPDDERYKGLDGKTAITPFFDKEVPIKAHPMADMEKGTGLVMMCSAGDTTDIRFFREMGLKPVIAIDRDGTMNQHAGPLKGMKVKDAREEMIRKLDRMNLLVKETPVIHRTPVCERSKDPIEFISMKEWYLKQVDYKDDMRKLANEMRFYADSSRQIMLDWIDSVSIDWPISRSRYYATEVPVWFCEGCNEIIIPPKGRYYQPWKDRPPISACPSCKGQKFRGDTRVFDTWFDSSISPLVILKWSKDHAFFNDNSPCTLRPQGKEIIRTWLYYTVLKCYHLTGKRIFDDVWINYHIVDEKGYKMSKSKGNVISPVDALDKYGAEPFRLWASIEGNLEKTDFRCNFERIEGASKTITKLWNVARFISMFPEPEGEVKLTALDNWIIGETNDLIRLCEERYMQYDFHNPGTAIKHFLWETFASHYLELAKKRAYNEEDVFPKAEHNGALHTLNYCLKTLLKLIAPITPLISYKLYQELYGMDVHFEEFPVVEKEVENTFTKDDIVGLNSAIWKYKKDNNLSLKSEIRKIVLPKRYEIIKKDISLMHNLWEASFEGDEIRIG